jgi:anti-sigma regulatory factor (Ser/Thr protein kinase)
MAEVNLSLAPTPESAGLARRFVAAALAEWDVAEATETATLLVSELVTNAMLHARTELHLTLRLAAGRLRLEVHDGSPRLPGRKRYSADSGTGRGLFLVEELSAAWGADHTAAGKRVWCEIGLADEQRDAASSLDRGQPPPSRRGRTPRSRRGPGEGGTRPDDPMALAG